MYNVVPTFLVEWTNYNYNCSYNLTTYYFRYIFETSFIKEKNTFTSIMEERFLQGLTFRYVTDKARRAPLGKLILIPFYTFAGFISVRR